jgi:hypothetical protein
MCGLDRNHQLDHHAWHIRVLGPTGVGRRPPHAKKSPMRHRAAHLAPHRLYLPAAVALVLAALPAPVPARTGRVEPANAAEACRTWRTVDGKVPLSWTWEQAHASGSSGIRTTVSVGPATLACARVHNVEDGWRPGEQPYPTNQGVMGPTTCT